MSRRKTPLTDAQPSQWTDDVMGPQEDRSVVSREFAEELEWESEIRRLTIVANDARIDVLEAQLAAERAELTTLKTALRPLAARIREEMMEGRPSLIAVQWHRLEPIAKALGIVHKTNPAPLP